MSEYYGKYAETMRWSQKDSYYYYYKSRHICVRCKKNKARPNRICCEECAENVKRYTPEKSAKILIKRNNRIAQNLCTYCGKVPPIDGQRMCEVCRDKRRERRRKAYIKNKAKEQ